MKVVFSGVFYDGVTGTEAKEMSLPRSVLIKGCRSFEEAINAVEMVVGYPIKTLPDGSVKANVDFVPIEVTDNIVSADYTHDIS